MRIDVGVTGGQPNLLGSLTAAARPLPENADWHAFGTSHDPENCGKAWPWQACNTAGPAPDVQLASLCNCDVYIYAPNGGFLTTPPNPVDGITIYTPGPSGVPPFVIIDDNTILIDFDCGGGWGGVVISGIVIGNNAGPIDGTFDNPFPVNVTISDADCEDVPVAPFQLATSKPLNPGVDDVRFKPFLAEYNAASCPGGVAVDWDQLEGRARRGLPVRTSNVLAQALSSSTINGDPNDSPNLPTVANVIAGTAGLVNVVAGLLEEAIDCGLTGEAFIHAPHWTLSHWLTQFAGSIQQVGSAYKIGPHTLVLDQGTTGEAPIGEAAAAVGQAWIYISGPIEYATGSTQVLTDTTRGVTVRENTANVMVAQLAIYRFDPCCVFAALAEVC